MLNTTKQIIWSKNGVVFSPRAIFLNIKRRRELTKKGVDVKNIKILYSCFFTLKKRLYNELKFGGSRIVRSIHY